LPLDPGMAADGGEALLTRRCFYLVEQTTQLAASRPSALFAPHPWWL